MSDNYQDNEIKSSTENISFSFKTLRSEHEKQAELDAVDDGVLNIYHEHMPKTLERKKSNGFKIFLISLMALVVFSAFFYYYGREFFTSGQFFTGDNIKLNIDGLKEVSAGAEVSYLIKYENLEKVDLTNAVLTVNYPPTFVFKKSRPVATGQNNNSWELGYVASQANGQVEISGSFIGEPGQDKDIQASLKYNLGVNKSTGIKEADLGIKILNSALVIEVSAPARLLGENIEYKIKYHNTSADPIENIKLMVTYPVGFVFNSSAPFLPQDTQDNNIWLINQLDSKQNKELIIKGRFDLKVGVNSEVDKTKIFKAEIGIIDNQDVFYKQQQAEFTTLITADNLLLNLKVNNKQDEKNVIELGDWLTYKINYFNQGAVTLGEVKVKLILNSNILDWSTLDNANQGVVTDEEIVNGMLSRSITWTLGDMSSAAGGESVVKIKTKNYSQLDQTRSLDLKVNAKAQAVIGAVGQDLVNNTIESNQITSLINTDLQFKSETAALNSTDYQLIWQLTNSIHEVKDVKIEASLTSVSSWTAETAVTAGDIYFDPNLQKVSWQLNRIPVGVDIPLVAKFKIKINQTETRPTLLTNLTLSATDTVTGMPITKIFSDVMGY